MEEDLILQQPADRRLGTGNTLPPGPPGAESDGAAEYDTNKTKMEKDSTRISASRSSRRRSPSGSPPRSRRKSPSRGRRSPSLDSGSRRRRRSPSPPPRRNRFRDYSPDRRRFDGGGGRNMRRSPDRRRGGGGRGFRFRGRSNSRSRSRSISPRRGSGNRWSPKKKPSSPLPINAPPPPQVSQPQTQYGAIPPQLYPSDTYAQTAYNQYSVPPPQPAASFPPQQRSDSYGMQAPAPPVFNAAYPPPPVWGSNDAYNAQQPWMPTPDPNQLQQITQQPPPAAPPISIPPPQIVQQQTVNEAAPITTESSSKHDAAVAQEAENQRDELKRQRSSYLKKTSLLRKELKMLKEQRKDLHSGGGAPPSPTTKGFIDENEKLQNQIQKKLNTIENVIDMLTGIIGEENLERDEECYESDKSVKDDFNKKHAKEQKQLQQQQNVGGNSERSRKKKRKNSTTSSGSTSSSSSSSTSSSSSSTSTENEEEDDDDSSPERLKNKAIESMKAKAKEGLKRDQVGAAKAKDEKFLDEKKRFNYVFYDPEMHWCQTCDVFPKTAKDYLNHLHSKEHMDRESIETPWHIDMVTDQFPTFENVPTKRTPIRGLTFFIPASAWFCKLCNNWMGDLHCASTHLKSQLHASKYNAFLEKNPHYEVNWLADRQRVLNERKVVPLPPQITAVTTTAAESVTTKKSKKEEKVKKRKKKSSDKKDKKKKHKRSKKRKKSAVTTSTSSDSSSSESEKASKSKIKSSPIIVQSLDNPNPAVSIRVAMRKQDLTKADEDTPPPPPRMRLEAGVPHPAPASNIDLSGNAVSAVAIATGGANATAALLANQGRLSKWTEAQDSSAKAAATAHHTAVAESDNKHDDAILQQWNTVQPVISESEKKLLEQLKGKLKNKPREESTTPAGASIRHNDVPTDRRVRDRDRDRDRDRSDRDRNDRNERDRKRRSRSPVFGGGRGGGGRGRLRRTRSRSRSRGRISSPMGRRRRTRSRSRGRRSRSFDRRRRYSRSRSRSRTRSGSRSRIEKPVVRHAEFRPRVPEKDKDREKRSTTESKDKKSTDKKSKTSSTAPVAAAVTGKKLPFIGKMPVFKKQTAGQGEGSGSGAENTITYTSDNSQQTNSAHFAPQRPPAPTAAQIQMAMMEDVYGNAPPFHPDAGMMMDYEELMPDPIQFVNLMGQAPPPPPPPAVAGVTDAADDTNPPGVTEDILPPGIDVAESEDCVPRPISDGPLPRKGPLPKDLEEALNIIFPGEKKPEDEEAEAAKKAKSTGETQIITDEPVMQPEDLVKEGIHMVTIEETSLVGMDEASQMSMNEPLVFNKPTNSLQPEAVTANLSIKTTSIPLADSSSQDATDIDLAAVQPPPPPPQTDASTAQQIVKTTSVEKPEAAEVVNGDDNTPIINSTTAKPAEEPASDANDSTEEKSFAPAPAPSDIPMPDATLANKASMDDVANIVYDLDDIPQPPPSPTESEKMRRQEELNDLAMLGIDADDMAAQCF